MKHPGGIRSGFTIVEITVATVILVVAVSMGLAGFSYFLRGTGMRQAQNDLDIDVQKAMERLNRDIRLSSLEEMYFYPEGAGPYTGISFPMARDDDGDGAVDLDEDGHIIWDKTLVYHVWDTEPNQLRLTTFDPRDNTLSEAERQEQLDSVVENGNGESTHNSDDASTRVVFENLFEWSITPRGSIYDAYAPTLSRHINVNLGSCLVDNGNHTFKFSVIGKHDDSSGYRIGLDTLTVSPCYGQREAEAQLPATEQEGATAVGQYMAGGSWSGNYQLYFPATEVGDYVTLTMENDRWEETNYRAVGESCDNVTVVFDQSGSPYDFVACLDGYGWNWLVTEQTGDLTGGVVLDAVRNCAVRVLVRGEEMVGGNWIHYNGGRCWVNFRAGLYWSEKLKILAAYIGECADSETPSMDVVAGTEHKLYFSGSGGVTINGGSSLWCDLLDYAIDKEKSYLVSFLVDQASAMGNAWKWSEVTDPTAQSCFIIRGGASPPTEADLLDPEWSARGDVMTTNCIFGVQYLYTTYPTNGTYISQVFDTHLDTPAYSEMDWNEYVPSGGDLTMKVRTGSSNDLSDAEGWTNITAMGSPGSINPGDSRYVQFRADFTPNANGTATPKLEDVTITWSGEEQFIDVGATITRGPDYGIFELTVDGERLISGVKVDLEIFKDVLGYQGTRRITSALSSEVTPRNSGR